MGRGDVEGRQSDESLLAKSIRIAILRVSITNINLLLHYLKSLVEVLISLEKILYSVKLILRVVADNT